jgi:ferritin-like metal-binding protein YciE
MSERTIDEQLTKYLTDVHSIEVQALAQLERAPGIVGDDELGRVYAEHKAETEGQESSVRAALEARGADPSTVKDIAGKVGGWAMIAFARLNPDTPGKLTAHAYSYEHMELAAYELLRRFGERAGDASVVALASEIAPQEKAMGERLASMFDRAVEASLREKDAGDIEKELIKYLRDAHAIESQAISLLGAGPAIAEFEPLARLFADHLEETRDQQKLVDARLEAHGAGPSRFQAAALGLGGLQVGGFFKAQPDTPLKLAGFAYAFEHLEIAAYSLLALVAERAGDAETVAVADRIRAQEQAMAERVSSTWDAVVDVALAEVGVSG